MISHGFNSIRHQHFCQLFSGLAVKGINDAAFVFVGFNKAYNTFIGLPYMEMQNFTEEGEYKSDMAEMFTGLLGNVLAEVAWYGEALAAARK